MPRLVVNPDSPEAWPIELQPGAISLGRSELNDFPIEHPSVSSSHSRITISADGVWVKDVGSAAGTFVNDELVEEARLQPGQTVRLGEVAMRFESEAAEDTPPPAAPPLAPRLAPLQVAAATSRCQFHPEIPASFACAQCQRAFCELCITARFVNGASRRFCRHCGSECQPLQPKIERAKPPQGFLDRK